MGSKFQYIKNLTDEEMLHICDTFPSATKYLESIGVSNNGRYITLLNNRRKNLCLEWYVPTSHLVSDCPVCGKEFKKARKEQTTCSKSCSNTYFRSGENHPSFKTGEASYRIKSIKHYGHKCLVCDEENVIEVHHIDENRHNNSIDNIIPLCPTHHRYMHSASNKKLIIDKIVSSISAVR